MSAVGMHSGHLSETQNLSLAITMLLGFGESASPQHNDGKVVEAFGHALFAKALIVLGEVDRLEINWPPGLTLDGAGLLVRSEIQRRYSGLNDLALDAIAWKYTFGWR
ncbi:hypothetical protein [Desulfovibrio subterraneus]|jgi:hypothetical protein|uniref:Uncharacterized protein n=1 Tax=Desulfovibrio subterraneus TaxID=2718620 RepID=A0A7J0BNC1_9BACT|nr:hypothetical protein [Desulfovibrio subterraneus]GFM35118.1 hypothetical protein DSM101010T_34830 [Desulfovibrio subterraneus]